MQYKHVREFLIELTSSTMDHDQISQVLANLQSENPEDYRSIITDAFNYGVKSIIVGNLNLLRKVSGYPALTAYQENLLMSFLKAYHQNDGHSDQSRSHHYYADMQIYFS
ncbi:MAG: hypothetical protein RIS03_1126 [Pseudomonadota bacterium]